MNFTRSPRTRSWLVIRSTLMCWVPTAVGMGACSSTCTAPPRPDRVSDARHKEARRTPRGAAETRRTR
jgi:hypothetical protein